MKWRIGVGLLLALAPSAAFAEPIGLVLAGGGARGGAHIGVLQVMEELRVPVDRIAGTSMGSIVGALYAVGYSPAEMERILAGIDWEEVFRDQPERRRISFRQKEDDRLALLPIELGVGPGGISAKSGIAAGTKIEFLFRRLTIEATRAKTFDELRIPYRAVAADLSTGESVVLDRGDLALAMRASMSIPGAFTPVEIGGRVLVDGGIADNMPVDVARQMGAERIIAIDVGTPPKGSAHGLSALGVLSQTLAVVTERNVIEQRAAIGERDLLITPELEGIGAGDFDKIAEAVTAGAAAARRHEAALRRYSVSEPEYAAFLARQRRGRTGLPEIVVHEIEVRGVPWLAPEVVTRRMRTKPGAPLDFSTLAHDLERVNQLGEFESVGFHIEPEGEQNRLVVELRKRPLGPGYVRLGMGFETTFDGDADFRALGYYRRARINRLGAEVKVLSSIGDPTAIEAELYQPLAATGTWFVAPHATLGREKDEVFLPDGTFESVEQSHWGVGADLGLQLRNYAEVRLGLVGGRVSFEPSTTTPGVSKVERDTGGARLKIGLDQVDNVFFPTSGNATSLEYYLSREGLGADDEFDTLRFNTFQALSVGRNTFIGSLGLSTDLGSDLPPYAQFELGGFLNLSGFERGALRGDVTGLLTLGDYWRVGRLGGIGKLYFGAIAQAGNAWADSAEVDLDDLIHSGTLFFGADNRITPVYLGYGRAEGGESAVYLFVGQPF